MKSGIGGGNNHNIINIVNANQIAMADLVTKVDDKKNVISGQKNQKNNAPSDNQLVYPLG